MKPAHTPSERICRAGTFCEWPHELQRLRARLIALPESRLFNMRLSVPRRHGQFRIHQLTGDRLAAGGFAKDVYAGRTPLWLLSLSDGEPTEHSAHLGQLGSHIVGVANLWPILRLKHHNPKGGALQP